MASPARSLAPFALVLALLAAVLAPRVCQAVDWGQGRMLLPGVADAVAGSAQGDTTAAAPAGNSTAAAVPAKQAAAHKAAVTKAKLHGPCAPDNARCIALRDHVCDPYFINVTDKCTFVQYNRHCKQDVHHIAYLPLFYCHQGEGRVFVALFFLLWMGVLFWLMSKVAEDFLVPALEYLAFWLRLTPDVAGVTLFAFASGAPDLFTQIAAVAAGGTVDQGLAISATLGGGLFIIAVIFSAVVLVPKADMAPTAEGGTAGSGGTEITDRRAFVRDAVAYLLSTLALLALMLRGTFSAWEAALLLLGYGAYLATCLLTSRGSGAQHQYAAAAAHHQAQAEQRPHQRQVQLAGGGGGEPPQLTGAALATVTVADPPGFPLHNSPRGVQVELVPRAGTSQAQRKLSTMTIESRLPSTAGGTALTAAPSPHHLGSSGGSGSVHDGGSELAALVAGMPRSDAPSPRNGWMPPPAAMETGSAGVSPMSPSSPLRGRLRSAGGSVGKRASSALQKALESLEELLHTKGKTGPGLWVRVMMAPMALLLHATMPALHAGHYYTPWYGLVLAVCVPPFMMFGSELYPHRLSTLLFFVVWLVCTAVLLALLLMVAPASSSSSSSSGGGIAAQHPTSGGGGGGAVALPAAGGAPGGSPLGAPTSIPIGSRGSGTAMAVLASSGGSSSGGGGGRWARQWWWQRLPSASASRWQLVMARRPRRNVLLAVLASVQCMLWMSVAADELVSLFQAIGRICDISQDLLGATVLAWGEAVPELVATISLSRAGQATMAIAAVFGGPIFNTLVAWAGPTLYASVRKGSQPYDLSAGVALLAGFTVVILVFVLTAFPLIFKWRLARAAALCILLIYGLSQLLFLLAEEL